MAAPAEAARRAAPPPDPTTSSTATLDRSLGALDGTLLTIGAMVGTGIFLTAGDVARAVPSPLLALLVWIAGGALTLAGALTYGELGTMYPRAGGLYHYLRAAWGPLAGFQYGWSCLLVIMTGGIAAIAVGFGEYLGAFVPWFGSGHTVWSLAVGGVTWSVNGAQLAGALAILALTAINHFGLRAGAGLQNGLTAIKLGSIALLIVAGLALPLLHAPIPAAGATPLAMPGAGLPIATAFLGAMIAALWTYDGWYALAASAGELRAPARDLPRALALGVAAVITIYLLLNLVYLRTMPVEVLAHTTRVAEAAAARVMGEAGARAVAAAVMVSALGCLSATILYASRIYHPMAEDGLFYRSVARIHPRWRTPVVGLWLQCAWAMVLALSGSYTQLFTYVTFQGVLMHLLAGLSVFRLRRTQPDLERPYRAWGYPIVPALFVAGMLLLTINTLIVAPRESLLGLGVLATGLPFYAMWRRPGRTPARPGHP